MRDTFMLPQMFEPRFHEECFQEPPFLGGVLENAPLVCAVAAALMRESFKRGQEFFAISGIDSVFNNHQDRPLFVLDFIRDERRRPVQGRREVHLRTGLQFPPPRQRKGQESTCRSNEVCSWQAHDPRKFAPNRAAQRHGSEKDGYEHRESAPAHPIRQRHWAETFRLDKSVIQETPAMRLAISAMITSRASPNRVSAAAVPWVMMTAAAKKLAGHRPTPGISLITPWKSIKFGDAAMRNGEARRKRAMNSAAGHGGNL